MLHIAHAPVFKHLLPPDANGQPHRFPMLKYELIPEQLLYEGTCTPDNFFEPQPVDDQHLLAVHTADYIHQLKTLTVPPAMMRRIGFPASQPLMDREWKITQGTIDCSLLAQQHGVAMNVAGGTHHAFPDRGEGFCLLNDIGVAAQFMLDTGRARQILIVDLDVHQGNGTAVMFQHEPRVFTFSVHGEANYPLRKEQSDLDIPLPTDTTDGPYLAMLHATLPALIDRVRPDFMYYLAGVDVLATDRLGKLALSRAGCRARDEFVFETAIRRGLPVAVSMGGGYSPRLVDIVEAHCNTFRVASRLFG
jgi:acetoin utilization deacetylase AcuC-like enzyme